MNSNAVNDGPLYPSAVSSQEDGTTLVRTRCGPTFDATTALDGVPWTSRVTALEGRLKALGENAEQWLQQLPEVVPDVRTGRQATI